jgi:hypothetical protein
MEELERRAGRAARDAAVAIVGWAADRFTRLEWGKGAKEGSVAPILIHNSRSYKPLSLLTFGKLYVQFGRLSETPPFDSDEVRLEFLKRLNAIPGMDLPNDVIRRCPSVSLAVLESEPSRAKLFEALEWFLSEARSTNIVN